MILNEKTVFLLLSRGSYSAENLQKMLTNNPKQDIAFIIRSIKFHPNVLILSQDIKRKLNFFFFGQ